MISLVIFALTRSALNYMNTTPSEMMNYSLQMPDFSTWNLSTTYSMPDFSSWNLSTTYASSMPTMSATTSIPQEAWAIYYFVSGAVFFLASALILAPKSNYQPIDGISTMSDFTKTKLRRYINESKPNREVMNLVESNGMEFEEFLNRLVGNKKRSRRSS